MKRPIIILAILALLISCGPPANKELWPYGVNYEVFVLSFADGNGDGKGDIPGLTAKLDYLQDLGIGGVWLMPIMPSRSYHKYDVTDYKGIDSTYGTIDDFKKFVQEAHKRKIQVVIDLIINHSGSNHPWFLEAKKGKDNPYRNYYVWAKKDSIARNLAKKETSLDSDNIRQWHDVDGDTTAEHFYGFFSGRMPDLNFDNPKVKEEIVDIGKFWLNEIGVDGFRLDAARHIFPTDRAKDNHEFWVWFKDEMRKIKPDVYIVGEVWAKSDVVAPYLRGIPALFNFDMGYAITSVVKKGVDTLGLVKKYKGIDDYYKSITSDFVDATFLKNHDQNRILSELGDDKNKMRVAASILFSLPGTPYVYYGEEIGMVGRKPDQFIREPFLWDVKGKDPTQTTWEKPRYSADSTVTALSAQMKDPGSLYNFYKLWICYRNACEVLTKGDLAETSLQDPKVVSLVRSLGAEKRLILHNISGDPVVISLETFPEFKTIEFCTTKDAAIANNGITLAPYASVVVKN